MSMPDTHQKSIVPLSEATCKATITTQWLLEGNDAATAPKLHHNNLQLLICGEEGFAQIYKDICNAKHSVDIICWGFDPAMELVRDSGRNEWPRGETWGDLLRKAAAGELSKGQKVQVRVLPWWDPIASAVAVNLPGFGELTEAEKFDVQVQSARMGMGAASIADLLAKPDPRMEFNRRWFSDARYGRIEGLNFRTRGSLHDEAAAVLKKAGGLGLIERVGLEWAATHHQKTILIDYEGDNPVAYIMGLNSVTDYWDTQEHRFNDSRRRRLSEGTSQTDHSTTDGWDDPSSNKRTLKPYQDYACRIRGEAVAAVCKNFDQAWNSARTIDRGSGANIKPRTASQLVCAKLPANLTQGLTTPHSCVQVLRTLPATEGAENSIHKLYHHAIGQARHYIYIENQYFQHADWARAIRQSRSKHLEAIQKCGGIPPSQVPALHLLIVIPTPEKAEMVPRTADTVAELGHGDSVPNHDKRIKDELAKHEAQKKDWDEYRAQVQAGAKATFSPPPPPLSPQAQDYLQSGGDKTGEQARKELQDALGIRALVASLWSCDEGWNAADTAVGQRIEQERRRYEKQMRNWNEWQALEATRAQPLPLPPMPKPLPPANRSKELTTAAAERYREVYIHSKLMIIDDSMFTLGSANINLRSFNSDSEINMATDDPREATKLRKRVWGQHTKGLFDGGACATDPTATADTFEAWKSQAKSNFKHKSKGEPLQSFLVQFQDKRTSAIRLS